MNPSLRQIAVLAAHDLRLALRDRAAFVWMLLLPLALMWMFGAMNRGGGPPVAGLAVEDRDGGWLARALVKELPGERIEITEIQPGRPAGPKDEAPARTLVIPRGFTAHVLAGQQETLRLEKASGAREEFSLAAEAHIVRAIVRLVGRLAEMGPPVAAGSQGVERQRAYEALAARPPLVSVAVSTAGGGHPVPQGFAQSVPGTLTMTVLMMTLIYGAVFLTLEKRQGMIRRQATLPLPRGSLFLGKLAGRLLIAGAQAVLLLLAGRFLFGLSWGSSPGGLALLLGSYLLAVAALSTFLGAILSTPEQASAVGWISSMILAALGGCWWPSEVMPRWLWRAAHVLPTPWAMDGFHALISYGHGIEAVLLPAAVLLAFAALFAVLGSRFLQIQ
ncbi:MAG: linearmycin/streptolysin transport system permease protein [Acidobacteriota bacterium]|jgi:ABC-type multidrug transport system permease subunit|nr:linearmycin/streptolysin transport system permease protein [Acidobacteriota bacterium]